jgi:hypothetical protein
VANLFITCFTIDSYVGGDDEKMKMWDIRLGNTPTSTYRMDGAGCTVIQASPFDENIIAVGR